jgi:hypothetical protein
MTGYVKLRIALPIALGILSSTIVVLDGRQDPSRPYAPARLGVAVGFEEGDDGPAAWLGSGATRSTSVLRLDRDVLRTLPCVAQICAIRPR